MNDNNWVFDVDELRFEQDVLLRSMQVPILVDFWAPWCAPCRQLAPVLEKIAAAEQGRVWVAKVNTDEQRQLASLFGVRSLPTVMLMVGGRPVDGFVGVQSESHIRALIAPYLADAPLDDAEGEDGEPEPLVPETPVELHERAARLRAEVAQHPENADLKLELTETLLQQGETEEARATLATLPAAASEGDRAKRLASHLYFLDAARQAPPPETLRQRLQDHPEDLSARHAYGALLLLERRPQEALEQFLRMLKQDRKFGDDLGRRSLIQAFHMVDDADLVSQTRRQMSALLF